MDNNYNRHIYSQNLSFVTIIPLSFNFHFVVQGFKECLKGCLLMCRQLWSIRQLDSPKHRRGMSFPRVFSILSFYVERTQFGKVCHAGQEPWKRELERLRPRMHHENSWKNRSKIVYNMKLSLHLITQSVFCTTKCRWAFSKPFKSIRNCLEGRNFLCNPRKWTSPKIFGFQNQ